MPQPSYHPALHRTALLTAAATFPLIFMGGLVTTKGAGMSVPDWPNSYGYNMFLFPPNQWVGGILYEHTHRLMATLVGFLSVILVSVAWGPARTPVARWRWGFAALTCLVVAGVSGSILFVIRAAQIPAMEQATQRGSHIIVGAIAGAMVCTVAWLSRYREARRWVRWLSVAVLGAVILQGVLGGLRVVLVQLDLAIVHACFAQAFFCLSATVALVTSRYWLDRQLILPAEAERPGVQNLARWAIVATVLIYAQLIVGATMRHYDAGLAIPDWPLHYGKLLPPIDDAGLQAANQLRVAADDPGLHPIRVTMAEVWLHFAHRCGAAIVSIALCVVIVKAFRRRAARPAAGTPAVLVALLLVAQLTLGVLTVLLRKPADIASLHVACGALVLVSTFLLAARTLRLTADHGAEDPAFEVVTGDGPISISESRIASVAGPGSAGRLSADRDNARPRPAVAP